MSLFVEEAAAAKMSTMSMVVDADAVMMDSIPRLRWSPQNNRFHYNMPVASEPGEDGFVMLQEFEHSDSFGSWSLPAKERHHLEEMDRINNLIHDVENSVHLHETVKVLEKSKSAVADTEDCWCDDLYADMIVIVGLVVERMHHDEFHERVVKDEDEKAPALKKKDSFRKRQAAKRSFEARRQKPTRMGRVQQPK
ncbi:hypothetical protein BBJ28_00025219 [Nothophytophthora sp. Chile5]|nr:hypothetical protein BBJ28_00025219 [Nothophytophthora sp. Chile5]